MASDDDNAGRTLFTVPRVGDPGVDDVGTRLRQRTRGAKVRRLTRYVPTPAAGTCDDLISRPRRDAPRRSRSWKNFAGPMPPFFRRRIRGRRISEGSARR